MNIAYCKKHFINYIYYQDAEIKKAKIYKYITYYIADSLNHEKRKIISRKINRMNNEKYKSQ